MSQYARSARLPVAANNKKKNRTSRDVRSKSPRVRAGTSTSRPLEPGLNAVSGTSNYHRHPLVSTENRANSATATAMQKAVGNEVSIPKVRWQRNRNSGPLDIVFGKPPQPFHQAQHPPAALPLPRQQQQPQANNNHFLEFSQLTDNFTDSSGSSNGSQFQNINFNSDESPEYHDEQQQQQQMQVHHEKGPHQNYAHHSHQGQDAPSNLLTMHSAASSNNSFTHSNQHQLYRQRDNNSKTSSSSENESNSSVRRVLPAARQQHSSLNENDAPMTTNMQAPMPRLQQQQPHLLLVNSSNSNSNVATGSNQGENLLYKGNAWKRALAQITPRRNNTVGSKSGGSAVTIDTYLPPCLSHPLLQAPSRTQAVALPPREPAATTTTTTTTSSEPFTPRRATALIRSLFSEEQEERTRQLTEAVAKVQTVQAKCEGVLAKCEGVQEETVATAQDAKAEAVAKVQEAEANAVAKIQEKGNVASEEDEHRRNKANEEFTLAMGEINTLREKASESYKQHEAGILGLADQVKGSIQQMFQTFMSSLPSLPSILPTNPLANHNKRKTRSTLLSTDESRNANGNKAEFERDANGRFKKKIRVAKTNPTKLPGTKTKESNASSDCTSNARKRKAPSSAVSDKENSSEPARRSKRIMTRILEKLTGKAVDDETAEAKSAQRPTVSTTSVADKPSNDETTGAKHSNTTTASTTSAADNSSNDETTGAKHSQSPTVSTASVADKPSNDETTGAKHSNTTTVSTTSAADNSPNDETTGAKHSPTVSTASAANKSPNEETTGVKHSHSPTVSTTSAADKTPNDEMTGVKHSSTVSTASAADKSSTASSPIVPVILTVATPRKVKPTNKQTAPPVRHRSRDRKNGKSAAKNKRIITTPPPGVAARPVTCKYPKVISLYGNKRERENFHLQKKASSVTPPLSSPDPTKLGRLAKKMRKSKQTSNLKFSSVASIDDPFFF